MAESTKGYEFTGTVRLEVVDGRNRGILWPPTGAKLRARWDQANLISDERSEKLEKLPPIIPGVVVEIMAQGSKRRLSITDPLGDPRNSALLEQVKRSFKAILGTDHGPEKAVVFDEVTDNMLKTWLYWARRMVDRQEVRGENDRFSSGPTLMLIHGTLPTVEQIAAMAGKTKMQNFDTSSRARAGRFLEDPEPVVGAAK